MFLCHPHPMTCQVFIYVAQRLCAEGAPKTTDQCQIKLKNLKAQYRYIKERFPQVAQLDLEDDEVLQRLVYECESRGISPYYTKHLRYLKRFLSVLSGAKAPRQHKKPSAYVPSSSFGFGNLPNGINMPITSSSSSSLAPRKSQKPPPAGLRFTDADNRGAVSPPASSGIDPIQVEEEDAKQSGDEGN